MKKGTSWGAGMFSSYRVCWEPWLGVVLSPVWVLIIPKILFIMHNRWSEWLGWKNSIPTAYRLLIKEELKGLCSTHISKLYN